MLKTVVAAAVVASFVLAVGAMPSETRATDASVKIGGRVLRDTARGATAPIVVYLRDQADLSARVRHARPGRARLVRLQDAQGARRADAGSAPRVAAEPPRSVPVLLGREHDRQPRRPDAREQARGAPRRPRDRVGRRLPRTAGRAAAAADSAGRARVRADDAREDGRDRMGRQRWSTRRRSGRSASPARAWSSRARTPASAGRTPRSRATTAAGTAARPTTTTTGTTRSTPAAAPAARTRAAVRRQRPRHAHDRHDRRRRRRRQPDRRRARREMDRLPQHGSGNGQPGDLHRVLPVLHRADRPRAAATRTRRSGPHVINNSWGCPPSEGCAANTLQTIVENTEAAGIFVEASRRQRRAGLQHGRRPAGDLLVVILDGSGRQLRQHSRGSAAAAP